MARPALICTSPPCATPVPAVTSTTPPYEDEAVAEPANTRTAPAAVYLLSPTLKLMSPALPELATLPDTTLTEPVSPDLVSPVFI